MKILFLFIVIYPAISIIQNGISLMNAFKYSMDEYIFNEVAAPYLEYSNFRIAMKQNRFFRPLTENAIINESPLSLTIKDVVLTLITNLALIPDMNYYRVAGGFQDTIIQYNITNMILEKKSENSSIYLGQFELSKQFISKGNDLMTSVRLVEFQKDTNDVLFNVLLNKTQNRIEFLISQYNIQFAFDTILSYSLYDSGLIKNSSLIYGIKNFSYEDASYENNGKQIMIQNSLTMTFIRLSDKAEIIARTNLLLFKEKAFTINEFYIVKSEIEVYTKNLNDNCDSILKEAVNIFYEQYDF